MKLPNLFTLFRLLSVPVLWVLAIKDYPVAFAIGFILAQMTDAIDGFLARRLDMVSEFGSKFDSLADLILSISVFAWLVILEPEFFQDNAVIFLVAIFIAFVNILVGLVKFKQLGNLHLYSSKAAGFLAFIFLSHTFLFDGYNQPMFYIVVSVYILSLLEGLIIYLTQDYVDEHMGSIVLVYKKNKDKKARSG
jgi:phosphatidylglycerophosphate synthase